MTKLHSLTHIPLPQPFDAYEIHGVVQFHESDGSRYCEPACDDKAHFWTLYGHLPGERLICIGDFPSREQAEEIYARITGQLYARSLLG